jgi:hypothetical protein
MLRSQKLHLTTGLMRWCEAYATVMQVLRSSFPDHALLGEEGGVSGDTSSSYLWCVDPLDGTTNFAHSYPCFAVSVAGVPGPHNSPCWRVLHDQAKPLRKLLLVCSLHGRCAGPL